jgi:hypothetical protein
MAKSALQSQPAATVTSGQWSVSGNGDRVECDHGGRRSAIDLRDPQRGIAVPPDGLLGLDLRSPALPTEHWLRGADVTAVYEPDDARRLRATAMWRLGATGGGVDVWELVVSAQTSLQQSDSSLAVASDIEAAECLYGDWVPDDHQAGGGSGAAVHWGTAASSRTTCVLLRRPSSPGGTHAGGGRHTSVLVAVHPADARGLRVHLQDGRGRVECRLFSTAVEKGVLLRGRVLAATGPAIDDTRWATAAVEAFAASPPMLST